MPAGRTENDLSDELRGLRDLDALRQECRGKLDNVRQELRDIWDRDHDRDVAAKGGERRFPFADEALALKAFYGKPLGQPPETLRQRVLTITCDEIDDASRRSLDPFDVIDAVFWFSVKATAVGPT